MFPYTHQRYLLSRFHHLDELLGDAVNALEPRGDGRLFRHVTPDASPAQREALADHLSEIRRTLRYFMDAHQLQDTPAPVSGLWSLRTALVLAQTAATEMRPPYMRGYGELDADARMRASSSPSS